MSRAIVTLSALFQELHRRRVFRVMAVYAVAGFLALQILELGTMTWGLPATVFAWAIWTVVAGAPLVGWLTWRFDVTPWGVLKTPPTGNLPAQPTGLIDRRIEFVIIALLVVALGFGIGAMVEDTRHRAATDARRTTAQALWDAFADTARIELFRIWPHMAAAAGDHDYDGGLPDYSLEGLAGQIRVLRTLHQRARDFDPGDLDRQRAFERDLVEWHTDRQLFWFETARWPQRNPAHYRSILSPRVYVDRPYAPLPVRLAAFTTYLERTPQFLEQVRARLKLPLPRTYQQLAIGFFGGMANYLERDAPVAFEAALVGDAAVRFEAANSAAVAAHRETVDWFESHDREATDDFAMGPELYLAMLRRAELLDVDLAELKALAERDLARNLAALAETCAALDAQRPVAYCVADVSAHKPSQGPVSRGAEQLEVLHDFVQAQNLVSIPGDAVVRVREAPPYRRANLAYIDIPGPLEPPGLPSIYYVAPPDPSWSPAIRRAFLPSEATLMFVSAHEVWPGHFLHGLHRAHLDRPLARLLGTSVFSEGWAHYAEQMMWEAGFGADDLRLRVGQLLAALTRDVRFVASIGLHTGGMTVAEAERLFATQAYADPGNARQQAARGTYDPGYFAYTLGKLMILDLRDEWFAQRAGRDDLKSFHDALLDYGSAPLPLVRQYMLDGQRPR